MAVPIRAVRGLLPPDFLQLGGVFLHFLFCYNADEDENGRRNRRMRGGQTENIHGKDTAEGC